MNKLLSFHKEHPYFAYSLDVLVLVFVVHMCWLALSRNTSDGLPPAETPADTGALRVSLLPIAECLPFYYAQATGIYDSLGLKLEIADRRAQFDADTALYGSSAHIAATDLVRLQYQTSRSQTATVLMGLQGTWGLCVSPVQRAANVKALKDRLLGSSRYSASDYYSQQVLASAELEYDDMLRTQANDFAVRANMLVLAQTEGAILPEPWLTWTMENKGRRLWSAKSDDASLGCLAANSTVLSSKRRSAQVALLVAGYNIAVEQLNKRGLSDCDTLIAKHLKIPSEILSKAQRPRYHRASLPTAKAIEQSRSFLSRRGIVVPNTLAMDDRFLKN